MDEDKLAEILAQEMEGLEEEEETLPIVQLEKEVSNPSDRTVDKKNDYVFARESIRKQLQMMEHASMKSLQNALSSDHPKMIEAFSKLMTTMTNSSEKLLIIQEKMNKLEGVIPNQAPQPQADPNAFYGSSADMITGGETIGEDGLIIEDE